MVWDSEHRRDHGPSSSSSSAHGQGGGQRGQGGGAGRAQGAAQRPAPAQARCCLGLVRRRHRAQGCGGGGSKACSGHQARRASCLELVRRRSSCTRGARQGGAAQEQGCPAERAAAGGGCPARCLWVVCQERGAPGRVALAVACGLGLRVEV